MRPTHYHIVSSGGSGHPIYCAEYTDGPQSIQDYLSMIFDVFGQLIEDRGGAENMLIEHMNSDKNITVSIGVGGPMILSWAKCICDFTTCSN
jgi:hypothetical protein